MTIEEMKARKRDLGYTNEQIAELSGVPLGTVQKIFSGETRSPRYDTIQRLDNALRSSPPSEAYSYPTGQPQAVAESPAVFEMDYYAYQKQKERFSKKISNADYAPAPVSNRIGIAKGKFKVPDDSFFYDDEISEMFEEL